MVWKWYSAKTLYRSKARGRPRNIDEGYVPGNSLVEERVVLFRARTFDEAMRQGEAEARGYARGSERLNRYGQRVVTRYLETINVFEMFEAPNAKLEVWSQVYVAAHEMSDRTLVDNHFGSTRQPLIERDQFLDGDVSELLRPKRK